MLLVVLGVPSCASLYAAVEYWVASLYMLLRSIGVPSCASLYAASKLFKRCLNGNVSQLLAAWLVLFVGGG